MKTTLPYHSALSGNQLHEGYEPLKERTETDGGVVFVWDMNDGTLPDDYHTCDLIYAEPAWQAGIAAFDRRAGANTPSFAGYMHQVNRVVQTLKVPTVLTIGKLALRYMDPPDLVSEVILNGNPTLLASWFGAAPYGATSHDVIRNLSKTYNRVGDFACGYGTTGRLFRANGKEYVMSDYNAQCCGFIAAQASSWGQPS